MMRKRLVSFLIGWAVYFSVVSAEGSPDSRVHVRLVTDEAEAVLAILAKRKAGQEVNVHPHAFSSVEDRARWDKDVANFNEDLKKVEAFFIDVLQGKLTEEQARAKGFSFFGTQGPWYTVGWRMATSIEKIHGRAKLIECMCDQRMLLSEYNRAAKQINRKSKPALALWSNAALMPQKSESLLDHSQYRTWSNDASQESLGNIAG